MRLAVTTFAFVSGCVAGASAANASCPVVTARSLVEETLGFTSPEPGQQKMVEAYANLDPVMLGQVYERLQLFRPKYIREQILNGLRVPYGRGEDSGVFEPGRFREWVETAILRHKADDPALVLWDRVEHLRRLPEGQRDGYATRHMLDAALGVLEAEVRVGRSGDRAISELSHDGYDAAMELAYAPQPVEGAEPTLRYLETKLADGKYGNLWLVQVAMLNHGLKPSRSLKPLIDAMRDGNNLARRELNEIDAKLRSRGESFDALIVSPTELADVRREMLSAPR